MLKHRGPLTVQQQAHQTFVAPIALPRSPDFLSWLKNVINISRQTVASRRSAKVIPEVRPVHRVHIVIRVVVTMTLGSVIPAIRIRPPVFQDSEHFIAGIINGAIIGIANPNKTHERSSNLRHPMPVMSTVVWLYLPYCTEPSPRKQRPRTLLTG